MVGVAMKFGVVFPTTEMGVDPGAIRDFAMGVEALGFDHLIAYDHLLGAPHGGRERSLTGPYDDQNEFHEVFVLFGYLAGVTERIGLVAGVLVAPQRQTALIAKQAAQVQIFSKGRLRLGIGTGWNWVEYDALGADFGRRGAVLDEQVVLLRRLWTEDVVSFDGEFHRIDRAGLRPLPTEEIPIWFGGCGPAALRRSATSGGGHLFGHLRRDTIDTAARIRQLASAAGRDVGDIGLEAITDTATDPERWAVTAAEWAAAGGTHLSVRTMATVGIPTSGCRTVDDHLGAVERWRDALRSDGVWT